MVIVTRNQYLLASKIHSVVLNESVDYNDIYVDGKHKNVKDNTYNITVLYSPDQAGSSNQREDRIECHVLFKSKASAHKVFNELIRQIREQMPDALFLDSAMEALLSADEIIKIQSEEDKREDLNKLLEAINDRSAKKVRRARKAKRNNKKLLGKPKLRR